MILFYIWVALAGLLCVLFVLKLLLQVGMAGSGHRVNWSSYNADAPGPVDRGVLPHHGAVRLSQEDAIKPLESGFIFDVEVRLWYPLP